MYTFTEQHIAGFTPEEREIFLQLTKKAGVTDEGMSNREAVLRRIEHHRAVAEADAAYQEQLEARFT